MPLLNVVDTPIHQTNGTYCYSNSQATRDSAPNFKNNFLVLALFISTLGLQNSIGFSSSLVTSCIEYSKAGILNTHSLEMKVRAIEMVADKYQTPDEKTISENMKKKVELNPRQYALSLLERSEKEWEIYTKKEANALYFFCDGGDV
jgi:hypothetical protein